MRAARSGGGCLTGTGESLAPAPMTDTAKAPCMCVCVCACVRACVRVCVCACVSSI